MGRNKLSYRNFNPVVKHLIPEAIHRILKDGIDVHYSYPHRHLLEKAKAIVCIDTSLPTSKQLREGIDFGLSYFENDKIQYSINGEPRKIYQSDDAQLLSLIFDDWYSTVTDKFHLQRRPRKQSG